MALLILTPPGRSRAGVTAPEVLDEITPLPELLSAVLTHVHVGIAVNSPAVLREVARQHEYLVTCGALQVRMLREGTSYTHDVLGRVACFAAGETKTRQL